MTRLYDRMQDLSVELCVYSLEWYHTSVGIDTLVFALLVLIIEPVAHKVLHSFYFSCVMGECLFFVTTLLVH